MTTDFPGPFDESDEIGIETRAYEIWEVEGRPEGRALEHWLQAERELLAGSDDGLRLAEADISLMGEAD